MIMAISLKFRATKSILHVEASGFDESVDDLYGYVDCVYEKALEENLPNVICDETKLQYKIGLLDILKAAKYFSKKIPYKAKLALIINKEQTEHAKIWNSFVSIFFPDIRLFYRIANAEKWILNISEFPID